MPRSATKRNWLLTIIYAVLAIACIALSVLAWHYANNGGNGWLLLLTLPVAAVLTILAITGYRATPKQIIEWILGAM
jgi:TRAP-type C4-dicarboxylate transport system permease small subunit